MSPTQRPAWVPWLVALVKTLVILVVVGVFGLLHYLRVITYDGYMSHASIVISDGTNRMVLLGGKGKEVPFTLGNRRCTEEEVKIGASPQLYGVCSVSRTSIRGRNDSLCPMWWLYDHCTGVAIETWSADIIKEKFLSTPCKYMMYFGKEPLFCSFKHKFEDFRFIDLIGLNVFFFEYENSQPDILTKKSEISLPLSLVQETQARRPNRE